MGDKWLEGFETRINNLVKEAKRAAFGEAICIVTEMKSTRLTSSENILLDEILRDFRNIRSKI